MTSLYFNINLLTALEFTQTYHPVYSLPLSQQKVYTSLAEIRHINQQMKIANERILMTIIPKNGMKKNMVSRILTAAPINIRMSICLKWKAVNFRSSPEEDET